MACFPRLFHHRSKNKFTPAEDENTDTILNTQDNPVVSSACHRSRSGTALV